MADITAGLFYVTIENSNSDVVSTACQEYAQNPIQRRLEHNTAPYSLTDFSRDIHENGDIFSGTLWKERENQFPSTISENQVSALNIPNEQNLGEAASFAYAPDHDLAILQHNNNGPRNSVLRAAIVNLTGLDTAITVTPVITDGAIDRLQDASQVRKLEFAIPNEQKAATLYTKGGSVTSAVDAMRKIGGTSVRLTISMGHNDGGLSLKGLKRWITRLAGQSDSFSTLKASIKNTPDSAPELIDLIGGRTIFNLSVPEHNRSINHNRCRSQLASLLRQHINRDIS